MSDCTIAKRWIEEDVQSPIDQFMTRTEQACEDFRQSYEKLVTTLVLVIVKVVVTVIK